MKNLRISLPLFFGFLLSERSHRMDSAGISILHEQLGENLLDFGFQVNDRYISASVFTGTGVRACVLDPNKVCLADGLFSLTANQLLTDTWGGNTLVDVAYYVIVS